MSLNNITLTDDGALATNRPETKQLRRCAIVGTAPTWKQTPWQDGTLDILGLNDAYVLGMPRATHWFDLHPFSQMVFAAGQKVSPLDVPIGAYMRPHGHLDWLKTRNFPVYLQDAPKGWPSAHAFPLAEVLAFWARFWPFRVDTKGVVTPGKDYESSTPALMLMWAVWAGYTEIHIYGIHLATEWEYVSQRPNLEMLIGIAAGLGVKIILPTTAPICQGKFRYAYEPKADLPVQAAIRQIDVVKAEGAYVQTKAAKVPWYAFGHKRDLRARQDYLHIQLMDARHQHDKARIRDMGL